MKVVHDFASARSAATGSIGLVPTMGFLHEGHLALIESAVERCDTVVVSVFVNPLQFGDPSDLDTYPRDLDRDVELAAAAGADVVFAPSTSDMFGGTEPLTTVTVDGVGDAMEGLHRPGHLDGVATIVAKLLAGVGPARAFFGRKDAQQLALVRTMAADLSFPVVIEAVPIVREHDGLALSSRNVRIPATSRADALTLSAGLAAGADRYLEGSEDVDDVIAQVRGRIAPSVDLDYIAVADARTASLAQAFAGEQFLAIAGTVAGVRLIDNVTLSEGPRTVDLGTRLSDASILYEGRN